MTEILHLRIYDLEESVIACRNPMRVNLPEYSEKEFTQSLERANKLCQLGGSHQNFLKGIRVSFDLKYPNYLSPELQRYNWIDIVSSSSKMFRLAKMDFNKYVTKESKEQIRKLCDAYNKNPSYDNFMIMLSNCPLGIELFMRVSTNYLQLKNIYKQRKTHKLKEDWGAFCEMIEGLPYFENFINK